MNVIAFNRVREEFGFLSNMAPISVKIAGHQWRTAEAAFQALRFEDEEIRKEIRKQKSPMGAKMVSKKHRVLALVDPMSPGDLHNMALVVRAKFEQHIVFWNRLDRTGDTQIVENCTYRRRQPRSLFWGAALGEDGQWEGENHLGRILMAVRDELRTEAAGE
jgi:ribA/ribD-fused uncharacterized protein